MLKQQEIANRKDGNPEDAERRTTELAILESELAKLESQFVQESARWKDVSEMKRELDLATESLAAAQRTANRLGFELQQCNIQLQSLERIAVLQEAPLPVVPNPDNTKPLPGHGKKGRKTCETRDTKQTSFLGPK